MDNSFFVNVEDWDADHCKYSKNILFRNKLRWILVNIDYVSQVLIVFLHDDAHKIIPIFNDINNMTNHWVFIKRF
jgi:hypothetical protein